MTKAGNGERGKHGWPRGVRQHPAPGRPRDPGNQATSYPECTPRGELTAVDGTHSHSSTGFRRRLRFDWNFSTAAPAEAARDGRRETGDGRRETEDGRRVRDQRGVTLKVSEAQREGIASVARGADSSSSGEWVPRLFLTLLRLLHHPLPSPAFTSPRVPLSRLPSSVSHFPPPNPGFTFTAPAPWCNWQHA